MKIKFAIAFIVFLCLGTLYFLGWSRDKPELATENGDLIFSMESGSNETTVLEESQTTSNALSESTTATIYVYVCGYVESPGVYSLGADARVFEAVEMAGGVSKEGCIQYMEMAGFLYDGQRIYVPSWEEVEAKAMQGADSGTVTATMDGGLININTAGKETLMELPGIGEAKAEAIIQYRNEVGRFTYIEDIMNISGIKEAAFAKIKEYICAY